MPYTKEQLKDIDFYQDFVGELRDQYLNRIDELKKDNFKRNGVLYSFEDITSTNGLEDAVIEQDNIYKNIELNSEDLENLKSVSDKNYPVYVSNNLLEKTIDRNITELAQSEFADVLPEGVKNGDVVTNDDFDDKSTFLILNNQKRLFDDIGIFYAEYDVSQLKTIPVSILDSIPTGEVVE